MSILGVNGTSKTAGSKFMTYGFLSAACKSEFNL